MKIHVGSKNQTKIQAVRDTMALYPTLFSEPEVSGIEIDVPLFGHPTSLDETVQGAIDRAKKAFTDCEYSFGLEGGLMEVPHSKTGFMEVGVCAIYDGNNIHLGLSPAYEWPTQVTKLILSGKADASQALKQLGLTKHEKIGTATGGGIVLLTDGRFTREEMTRISIMMALIHIEKPDLFTKE